MRNNLLLVLLMSFSLPIFAQTDDVNAGNATLIVKSEYACTFKVDFEDVANLQAGQGKKIKISAGEHLLEAVSHDGENSWDMEITIAENSQKVIKIQAKKELVNNNAENSDVNNENTNSVKGNKFTDSRNGKTYKTVKIGNQVWMAENLAYKKGSGCWAYDGSSSNVSKYGYLYDWSAAKSACPSGWHLPTKGEFETMLDNVGGSPESNYRALRPSGNSGFVALFGGLRNGGNYFSVGKDGSFWSSSPDGNGYAWSLGVDSSDEEAYVFFYHRSFGFSVRCVQDR